MKWQKLQRFVFLFFMLVVITSVIAYAIWGDHLNLEQFREYLRHFGIWAPLVFILLYILGTIFIPSTPFMAVAGLLFGFKYGLLYTIIGGFISSLIVFGFGRFLGKEWVENILQHRYLKHLGEYNKRLERGAVWDLIILRAAPVMPFNVLNILMGVSRIKTRDYMIGTIVGLLPSNVLAVYLGSFITELF